jgi:stage IV sporulation protein A
MPFVQAAEMGTRKVIYDHATIGMVVTTDGSIGDLPRGAYTDAEERVVSELKSIGKPFAVILNTANPAAQNAIDLAYELEAKYGVPVALVNCLNLGAEDIRHILEMVLHEFPVRELRVTLPAWTEALDPSHRIRQSLTGDVRRCAATIRKAGDVATAFEPLLDNEYVRDYTIDQLDLGEGCARVSVALPKGLYYDVISEMTGFDIHGEEDLMRQLVSLAEMKTAYDRVADALQSANENGYGIVMPEVGDLRLEEPRIVKQAGGYGVHLRAAAQSIHMIRANIETEINPIVGTEQQSEDLMRYMMREFEEDPASIWKSNLFGKTLYELVNEGLHAKLDHMSGDSRTRICETLERIINEGSNGLICILL